MQNRIFLFLSLLWLSPHLHAQTEPGAGQWKTWFIPNGQTYRLPAPGSPQKEAAQVIAAQKNMDAAARQRIEHWNTGSPGYHWTHLMDNTWMSDALNNGILANMLLNVALYDATIAAWDSKYAHKRPRPFAADKRIKAIGPKPDSPSYPCEHSVAAGVASTLIAHFFPKMADSVRHMAADVMAARVAAGMAYPSDTRAGFDLGKKIAEAEIALTQGYLSNAQWDGKMPDRPGLWNGKFAMLPYAGQSKTIVLENGQQFRPGPPPDFAQDMAELKNLKQTPRTMYNALRFDRSSVFGDLLDKKIFEHNLHLNPPRAARLHALVAIGTYDCFVACWDAKYTYWGIRPEQYDTTFHPLLLASPPFPGYPSGHAAVSGVMGELFAYFFPTEAKMFRKLAQDGAESRFQGGIHFRSDNDAALELGCKVAQTIIQKVKADGADVAAEAADVGAKMR